jgi:hypothetical protein
MGSVGLRLAPLLELVEILGDIFRSRIRSKADPRAPMVGQLEEALSLPHQTAPPSRTLAMD